MDTTCTRRVDTLGYITYNGHRYYLGRACGHSVGVVETGKPNQILVIYRGQRSSHFPEPPPGWAMVPNSRQAHYFVRSQSLCALYISDTITPGPDWHDESAKCPKCAQLLTQPYPSDPTDPSAPKPEAR